MIAATVTGRLGGDAEVRQAGGSSVCSFTMASDRYDSKTKTKVAEWVRVSLWGKRGDTLAQYLTRGSTVAARGELSTRTYDGKDGQSRTSLELRADDVELLGGKPDRSSGGGERRGSAPMPSSGTGDAAPDDFGGDGADIPF